MSQQEFSFEELPFNQSMLVPHRTINKGKQATLQNTSTQPRGSKRNLRHIGNNRLSS